MKRIVVLLMFSFIFLGCSPLNEKQPGTELEIVDSGVYFVEEVDLVSFEVKIKNNTSKEIACQVELVIRNQLLNEFLGVDSYYIGEDVFGTKELYVLEGNGTKTVGKTFKLEMSKDDIKKITDDENGIEIRVYFDDQVISTNPSYHNVKL